MRCNPQWQSRHAQGRSRDGRFLAHRSSPDLHSSATVRPAFLLSPSARFQTGCCLYLKHHQPHEGTCRSLPQQQVSNTASPDASATDLTDEAALDLSETSGPLGGTQGLLLQLVIVACLPVRLPRSSARPLAHALAGLLALLAGLGLGGRGSLGLQVGQQCRAMLRRARLQLAQPACAPAVAQHQPHVSCLRPAWGAVEPARACAGEHLTGMLALLGQAPSTRLQPRQDSIQTVVCTRLNRLF